MTLRISVPPSVRSICTALNAAGFEAWVVGGAVRDALREGGGVPKDWDIATNAHPDAVLDIFPVVIPTGIDHGTVTVRQDGEGYEVTTFRGEGGYSDGRRPDTVDFVQNIESDLARRDFTMNAIAYDPLDHELVDPFGGVDDIRVNRLIRSVGNPKQRFEEDGLRCLRAVRFAATLDFEVDTSTLAAIGPSLASFQKVAKERVRDEWLKALKAKTPSKAFNLMRDYGILAHTVPELLESVGCKQNRYHEYDVWGHSLAVMDALPPDDAILRITGLMHDIAKPRTKCFDPIKCDNTFHGHDDVGAEMVGPILKRLRFSREERVRVAHLTQNHIIHYHSEWQDKAVRRWVKRVTDPHLDSLFTLARADIAGKGNAAEGMNDALLEELRKRIDTMEAQGPIPTSIQSLAINGKDLMQVGVPAGPEMGRILKALLEQILDDPSINTREALRPLAKQLWKAGSN